MKPFLAKISLILVISTFFISCSVTKNLKEGEIILSENKILINTDENTDEKLEALLKSKPNSRFLKLPLRLSIYNLANKNPDSSFLEWSKNHPKTARFLTKLLSPKQFKTLQKSHTGFHNWLKKSGEAPVLIDSLKINASAQNIQRYYQQNGWKDAIVNYKIAKDSTKEATVSYYLKTGKPYHIDSLEQRINNTEICDILERNKHLSFIKKGKQYSDNTLIKEREHITNVLRNAGFYFFKKDRISFQNIYDSIKHTYRIETIIKNQQIKTLDSSYFAPHKPYKISDVRIYTDFKYQNIDSAFTDSAQYHNYKLYSFGKLRYKPKAITNAVFIKPNSLYKDYDKSLTLKQLNNLKTFKYPTIKYKLDPRDSTNNSLVANILLSPLKRFELAYNLDALHNNIQNVGLSLSTSLLARNVFRGAETLQVAFRGAFGASKDASDNTDQFFDVREFGADIKLSFPRIFFPINAAKIIPKKMSPTTHMSLGASTQTNIGLDKTTFTGILNYTWYSSKKTTHRFDLFNTQFVRNLNPDKYFNVYANSYNRLNNIAINTLYTTSDLSIPEDTNQFINDALTENLPPAVAAMITDSELQEIRNIEERQTRLTKNNVIFTTSYSFTRNSRQNLLDKEFSRLGFKIEFAGNTTSLLSKALKLNKDSDNRYELFNVAYSQYIKTEIDYIRNWDLSHNNILAFRSFFGIAIPYGNANSIPFSRSFFAGGSNDNRAWDAYSLGPGSSNGRNEFNEANMKISLNVELRYDIFGDLKGAIFIDAGNIWNVLDNEDDPDRIFSSFSDFKNLAIGSGTGFRYDFNFFILRFDVGFKTYEPYQTNKKWFRNYNFKNAVYNFGINYPF